VFFTKLKILILGNCIKGGWLLLGYHISIELQSLLHQTNFSSLLTCLQSVLLARIQYERNSKAFNVMVVFVGNIALVERESPSDYRFPVQTGASIDWHCATYLSMSLSKSTPVDFTESMFTHYEPLTSSIFEPLPATVENNFSSAVTFQILEDSTTKGRPKLIDNRGYCYNIKCRRAHATDWQCTVRPKVTIVKLS